MVDPKILKITAGIVGFLGLVMSAVAIWAMAAPYTTESISISESSTAGKSPALALSAGIFSILLAAFTFWANLEDKKHKGVLAFSLVLVLVLSIAAMSIAVRDLHNLKNAIISLIFTQAFIDQLLQRCKAVAVVSGISCLPQIVGLIFVGKSLV